MGPFHSESLKEILSALGSAEAGLSTSQAEEQLKQDGENRLPVARAVPGWKRFLQQFDNVLIHVLLVCAVISLLMRHFLDAGVILGVVIVNAIVGFIQEGRAHRALNALIQLFLKNSFPGFSGYFLRRVECRQLQFGQIHKSSLNSLLKIPIGSADQ